MMAAHPRTPVGDTSFGYGTPYSGVGFDNVSLGGSSIVTGPAGHADDELSDLRQRMARMEMELSFERRATASNNPEGVATLWRQLESMQAQLHDAHDEIREAKGQLKDLEMRVAAAPGVDLALLLGRGKSAVADAPPRSNSAPFSSAIPVPVLTTLCLSGGSAPPGSVAKLCPSGGSAPPGSVANLHPGSPPPTVRGAAHTPTHPLPPTLLQQHHAKLGGGDPEKLLSPPLQPTPPRIFGMPLQHHHAQSQPCISRTPPRTVRLHGGAPLVHPLQNGRGSPRMEERAALAAAAAAAVASSMPTARGVGGGVRYSPMQCSPRAAG